MTPIQVLQQAIALFGNASNCAKAAGVTPQVISNAIKRKKVSPKLAVAIERATDWRITRDRLVWGDVKSKKAA